MNPSAMGIVFLAAGLVVGQACAAPRSADGPADPRGAAESLPRFRIVSTAIVGPRSLAGSGASGEGIAATALEISRADGARRVIALDSSMSSIDAVASLQDKAIAVGPVRDHRGHVLQVLHAVDWTVGPVVRCFNPSVAPDGSRILFESFVPKFPGEVRSHLAVLDLRTASEVPTRVWPVEGAPGDVTWYQTLIPPVLWSSDSKRAFVVEISAAHQGWGDPWVASLVKIDFSGPQTKTSFRELDVSALVKPGTPKTEIRFSLLDFAWENEIGGKARMQLVEFPYWIENRLIFDVERLALAVER